MNESPRKTPHSTSIRLPWPEGWEKIVENGGNYFDLRYSFIFPSEQINFGNEKTAGIKFNI